MLHGLVRANVPSAARFRNVLTGPSLVNQLDEASMPRYFFHVYAEGDAGSLDAEGLDLPGDDTAWAQAIEACGQMIQDLDGAMVINSTWRMHVVRGDTTRFRLAFHAEREPGD